MSLNEEQLEGTRRELARNLELCGIPRESLAVELGWSVARFDSTLEIAADSEPADVWMLRDALERTVREGGGTPDRYTVLTESSRPNAERWFGLPKRRQLNENSPGP